MTRLGRRGGILTLFGIAWIACGAGFAIIEVERFSRPGAGGVLEFMDSLPLPGIFWMICGAVALINGIGRRHWDCKDAVGYAALVMPPMLWVLAYSWSFILWVLTRGTGDVYGRETSFLGVAIFLVITAIIRIVASWPDPSDMGEVPDVGSDEKALLDRLIETKPENDARGQRARIDSENWIARAREETEYNIQASATENDRMIRAAKDEAASKNHSPPDLK